MGSIPQLSIVKGRQSLLYTQLLHRTFEERVDKTFGEKLAMIYRGDDEEEERRTNYNTLNSSANRIASALLDVVKSKNLQANGDDDWIVAVCMKPSDHLVTTLLAIWKCGGNKSHSRKHIRCVCNLHWFICPPTSSCVFTVGCYIPCQPHSSYSQRVPSRSCKLLDFLSRLSCLIAFNSFV